MMEPVGEKDKIGKIKASVPPLSPHESRMAELEEDRYQTETQGIKDEQAQRRDYARNVFILCCCWVVGIYLLLIGVGFGASRRFHFVLSDRVMLAAIGSTTANIFGVFLIVIRYIFPKR